MRLALRWRTGLFGFGIGMIAFASWCANLLLLGFYGWKINSPSFRDGGPVIFVQHNSHASRLVWDCVANQSLAVLLLQALCASVLAVKLYEKPLFGRFSWLWLEF